MIRVKEFGQAMRVAELKIHVALTGNLGAGKTYLLEKINKNLRNTVFFPNPSFTKQELAEALDSDENNRTYELIEELKNSRFNYVLIDNLHTVTKTKMRLVLELAEIYTIVAAAEEIPERLNHLFHVIELEELDYQDAMMLINEFDSSINKKTARKIVRQSRGNPMIAKQVLDYFKATGEIKVFRLSINRKQFATNMISIAYLFMSIRYVFMVQRKWELYATTSMIAYTLLSVFRYMKRR